MAAVDCTAGPGGVTADPYSDEVRRLFSNPAHAGELDSGMHSYVQEQGVRVRLTMSQVDDHIEKLRFQAWGCPHLVAACELFCASFETRPSAELLRFKASELMQSLPVPMEKTSRILVLEDAVRSLGTAASDTSN